MCCSAPTSRIAARATSDGLKLFCSRFSGENAPRGWKTCARPLARAPQYVCDTAKHGEAQHGELSLKLLCSQGTRQAVVWRSRAAYLDVWFNNRTTRALGRRRRFVRRA